ncbi:MAG: hypothetical protein QOF76_2218, partial [Solirubrobacteraceae bacterium]|nr:hypothetical protein [Solirubrobacteraceae bacterium]
MRCLLVLAAVIAGAAPAAAAPVTTKTLARHLHVPWGVAFLPNGDGLVSERPNGNILRIPAKGGPPQLVRTITDADPNAGEGGLLGLAVSPTYKQDRLVYAYYTSREGGNRIVRFRLYHGAPQTILDGIRSAGNHNGGRIAFGPDGKLYAGVGEAGNTSLAQDLGSLNGKILR